MKTTDYFKQTIQAYLEQRAAEDELFAAVYANPAKSIDDCVTYILNTVKASGCNGFADDEIYSMALHYYDEPDIEVGGKVDMQVVVNHTIQLSVFFGLFRCCLFGGKCNFDRFRCCLQRGNHQTQNGTCQRRRVTGKRSFR